MEVGRRFAHRRVPTADGDLLSVRTIGEGPPLVLVPGFLMSASSWIAAPYVDVLARRWTVVLTDPLGHGKSSPSTEPTHYTPSAVAGHVVTVLDALAIPSATCWGYSRGAHIVAAVAWRHPDRVRSAVLGGIPLGAAAPRSQHEPDDRRRRMVDGLAAGDWATFWDTFPVAIPADLQALMSSANDPQACAAVMRGSSLEPWPATLPLPMPVFAYWGDEEPFSDANANAARRHEVPFAVVPGGHAQAHDAVARVLAAVEPFLLATAP